MVAAYQRDCHGQPETGPGHPLVFLEEGGAEQQEHAERGRLAALEKQMIKVHRRIR
jgi:hypothetical protein